MRRHVVTALALAGLLLVAGCDSGDAPTPGASTTSAASTPTATASSEPPGPVEPTLPDEATKPTKAGAEAFVRFYWDAVSYALLSGDTTLLSEASTDACAGCESGASFVDGVYRKGGHITTSGAPYRVTSIDEPLLVNTGKVIAFECVVTTKSSRHLIDIPGRKIQRTPSTTERAHMTLVFRGGWAVATLGGES